MVVNEVNEQLADAPAKRVGRLALFRSLWTVGLQHPALSIFLVSLIVRLVAIFTIGLLPDSYVFAVDNTTYSDMATAVVTGAAENWDDGTRGLYDSTFTFMGPVTLIYALTNSKEVVAEIFVAVLGAGTAALVTRLGLEFLGRLSAVAAGLVVALLPSQVLWSSLLLKDAAVWLVLAGMGVAVAFAAKRTGSRMLPWVFVAGVLLLSLGYLRAHTTVVAAWALAAAGFVGSARQRLVRGAATLCVAVIVPWMAGLGPAGMGFVTGIGSLEYKRASNALGAQSAFVEALSPRELSGAAASSPEIEDLDTEIAELEQALAATSEPGATTAGAGHPSGATDRLERRLSRLQQSRAALAVSLEPTSPPVRADEDNLEANLAHLPKGLAVMLLEPFPWTPSTSATFQLARAESLVWYPLLILSLVGLWRVRHHLDVLAFPLLAGLGTVLVYALAEGNLGTAFRHRGEFVWVVALIAGLGVERLIYRGRKIPSTSESREG